MPPSVPLKEAIMAEEFTYGDLAMVRVLSHTDHTPQLACYRPIWAADGWEFFGTTWTATACEVEVIERVRVCKEKCS